RKDLAVAPLDPNEDAACKHTTQRKRMESVAHDHVIFATREQVWHPRRYRYDDNPPTSEVGRAQHLETSRSRGGSDRGRIRPGARRRTCSGPALLHLSAGLLFRAGLRLRRRAATAGLLLLRPASASAGRLSGAIFRSRFWLLVRRPRP